MTAMTGAQTAEKVESRAIGSSELLGTFPAMTAQEVATEVATARSASQLWRAMGFPVRERALLAWASDIAVHHRRFTALIHGESGKPVDDAFMELVIAVEHIRWAARNAKRVLRRRRVSPGALMANYQAAVEHEPFGVIGVISPWNYPLFAPVAPLASALAAGNSAVLKPSEYTSAVGAELVAAFARANPDLPAGVLTLVTGFGQTGAALVSSGVDKIAFTGSPATARRILQTCAGSLTPAVVECGGKDAVIVAADADIDAAADAVAWGGFSNAGQTCVGVERVYVDQSISDRFVAALSRRLAGVRVGTTPGSTYGPMTVASQADIVREHVADAVASGAATPLGGLDRIDGRDVSPILLVDGDESGRAIQEETFGPVVTIRTVADADEAVRLANGTTFGLGAAVFAKRDGDRIAAALRCGMVSINSVLAFTSIPALPFGGVGDSGYGRIHGAEGLREFSRTKAISRKVFDPPALNGMRLDRPVITMHILRAFTAARFRFGKRSVK